VRVEQVKPPSATTAAQLVIATNHDPGSGGKERRRWREEIRLPRLPIIAVRASGAPPSVDRTCALAVIVIADVDHQIGLAAGRTAGDCSKRPGLRVVTILDCMPLKPTASVADDHDLPHFWR
jgi:hypothetical protein